jgi:hypothetical protein
MSTTAEERNRMFVLGAFGTLANRRDFVAAQRFWSPDYIPHSAHVRRAETACSTWPRPRRRTGAMRTR